jgi:sugar lactone lactonase YvrE
MIGSAHTNSRSLRSAHWCGVVAVFALMLVGSSCSGSEPPTDEPAEQAGSTATDTRTGDTESGTTQSDDAPERQRRPGALVWVALENAEQVALVDVAKGKVVARHDTPGGPHNLTVAGNGTAAATLYASDRLVLARRGSARFVTLGATPHDVKAAGELFVVANEAGRRLDLIKRGEHAGSIELRAEPHDLAISSDENTAWVTLNGTDELAVVDLGALRVIRYIATGQRPHDILFAPDGKLWVTDWSGPVHVFDGRGKLRGRIALGDESHHLAFTPNGKQAWITDHAASRIFIVDARRLKLVNSVRVSGGPHHVAITPDGTLAAVADHEAGTVVVYDVRRRTRVRTVPVGPGPHGVWAVPAQKRA